jgi:hypothetical protein
MKMLPFCLTVLALSGLVGACQKREPTRPAQPTVTNTKTKTGSGKEQSHCSSGIAGFAESVRRRHFDLP